MDAIDDTARWMMLCIGIARSEPWTRLDDGIITHPYLPWLVRWLTATVRQRCFWRVPIYEPGRALAPLIGTWRAAPIRLPRPPGRRRPHRPSRRRRPTGRDRDDLPSVIAVVVRSVVAPLDSAPRRGGGNADSSSVTMLDRDKPHVYDVLVTCRSL